MDGLEALGRLSAIGSLAVGLLELTVEIGLLAIALGAVRRKCPEASPPLVLAGSVLVVATLASRSLPVVLAFVGSPTSIEVATRQMIVSHVIGLARVLGLGLVLAGIARLAAPARGDAREPS